MIAGGGALLILHDRLGGSGVYLAMAALTLVATIPVALAREPKAPPPAPARRAALAEFFRRPGVGRVLAVVVVYKLGDAFATGMLRPFLADAGLSMADIGWLLGGAGFAFGLAGALVGGSLINRLGRRRALIAFGAAQVVTIAGYAYLASRTPTLEALYAICAAEHLAGGMATAALFTCMMDWCSRESSATDYTIQASAVVIATGVASALAGFSAQAFGYVGHFCLATGLAVAAVAIVRHVFPAAHDLHLVPSSASEASPCA
jgi:MFS transporter, PAT family, beta-lactamase induction signal transducer AmpG